MLRAQRVSGAPKLSLHVAAMPPGEDPADILDGARAGDAAAKRMGELLDAAVEMTTFHVRKVLDEADLSSPAGRDRALDEVVPVLAGMGETITRDELEREVASRLSADPELVRRRVKGGKPPPQAEPATRVQSRPKTAQPRVLGERERRERRLLAMCVAEPSLGEEFLERLEDLSLSSPLAERGRAWLATHLDDPTGALPRDDDELVSLVVEIKTESEREPANRESMEFHLLGVKLAATDDQIAGASGEELRALQKLKGEYKERIARFRTPGAGLVKSSPSG